jgi:uncharacterized membrane protein YvlD (DUF360 family)
MAEGAKSSPALRLAIRAVGNLLLIYGLDVYTPQYVTVFGGPAAYVIIGSLLTLLNLFLRPILAIVTLPFKLFFTAFTVIAVNAFFLWVTYQITLQMDPSLVAFAITGGVMGWIVVSTVMGIANWAMKHFI